mgnify:CR=1 FL=1
MSTHNEQDPSAPPPPEKHVRVKSLVWRKYRNGDAEAVTEFGDLYTAYVGGAWRMTRNGNAGKFTQAGENVEAAKSAAQADYERRILSCLSSTTEGSDV